MILDQFGKPAGSSTLGLSIRMMRYYREDLERSHESIVRLARVQELRRSLGIEEPRQGDTIKVRLPRRYLRGA